MVSCRSHNDGYPKSTGPGRAGLGRAEPGWARSGQAGPGLAQSAAQRSEMDRDLKTTFVQHSPGAGTVAIELSVSRNLYSSYLGTQDSRGTGH